MSGVQPHPGIPVKAPLVPPVPGQVIVQYQIVEPELGCCKCDDLTGGGLALLIIGILIFWPIALIPCFSASMKHKSQVPVYGYPGQAPAGGIPVAGVANA
mmetsp:Transcript_40679/g.90445  ORF Transcript_40679/g.90445 Transcript_40679/m.90445 type:complete len:100 (+) Transcript_40679:160-459(+)|eukprot:CAMPEP_0202919758 /NCGR_PEP_ID=MMETSP1392-20130828/76498_1 /ASSEMBLY_ACC=CAM_ASM_000868 /TAXON_ID=225041 /ORGANISM="Chlamydomonas chlamydogama, Strain SAG 11-48b" /LENGTH=99 /DNA_ID=CAMNT_0049613217 /DNA_START=656 /DNA_END=955 /DNA_ORIENTATION=-